MSIKNITQTQHISRHNRLHPQKHREWQYTNKHSITRCIKYYILYIQILHIFTPKNIRPKSLITRNPVRYNQHENTKFKNHKNNKNKVQRQSRGIRILLYATLSSKHNQQFNKNQSNCISNSNMGAIHGKQILLVRNCQWIGHSCKNCKLRYRCIKCLDQHLSEQCNRTENKDNRLGCINCGEYRHPANYRRCTFLKFARATINGKHNWEREKVRHSPQDIQVCKPTDHSSPSNWTNPTTMQHNHTEIKLVTQRRPR